MWTGSFGNYIKREHRCQRISRASRPSGRDLAERELIGE
jgi:hypothetical protein